MKKPDWISERLAGRYEIAFLSGPRALDQDWRPTEIREIPGTRDSVKCVFVSKLRGEQTLSIPTEMLDDDLFLASVGIDWSSWARCGLASEEHDGHATV